MAAVSPPSQPRSIAARTYGTFVTGGYLNQEGHNMNDPKDQNVVRAYFAADRKKAQLWAIILAAALLCTGAAFYLFQNQPDAQTTSPDGRKIESPDTATSGSAR
jgi:hypothetical protein